MVCMETTTIIVTTTAAITTIIIIAICTNVFRVYALLFFNAL